ncbi:Sec23-binding domain of Sec16-domain-containing protein [Diplogelasinospora grovesii]|uniref:Protein transport protein sec16 n=1 Tax=Diplogelasinospora grovesii TaxID=303347 RepID=A0AAN6N5I7_9PEZI|nr:Sec23-binding domain of Sec16-domain-containing protein [Diplogelasinospora grovesii]
MISDAPSASWHPAMMPNSVAELPRNHPKDLPRGSADHRDTEEDAESTTSSDAAEEMHNKSAGPDAWFPDYGSTGDDWLKDTSNANAPAGNGSSSEPDEAADTTDNEVPNTSSAASKHLSTMSFARTVSHEVSWNDDDDSEWSSPKTGVDPVRFMPPNDRSNSFPPVPPRQEETEHEAELPLPSNQAESVVHKLRFEDDPEQDAPWNNNATEEGFPQADVQGGDSAYRAIGGDLHGTTEEDSEARFEEGVPLISHDHENGSLDQQPGEDRHDPFGGEDAADDDDFFSKVQDSQTAAPHDAAPQTLERKSTMQVLNAMDMGSTKASFDPLAETAEEEEEDASPEIPAASTGANDEQAPKAETQEDLDAKWKAMFAGDEDESFLLDDDLLPDDTADTKEVDPAAFLDDEGFLEDSDDLLPEEPRSLSGLPPATEANAMNGRYLPPGQPATPGTPAANPYFPTVPTPAPAPAATAANPYLPAAAVPTMQSPAATPFATLSSVPPPMPTGYGYGAQPPPPPQLKKAQSFVDKAKGGYTSPYDLPMEVVVPKKRASTPRASSALGAPTHGVPPPPPRSGIMYSQPPPTPPTPATPTFSTSTSHPPPPGAQKLPPPVVKARESFFEELPMVAKPRPTSRHSNKSAPSPVQATNPYGPPQAGLPPPQMHPPQPSQTSPEIPQLVAPPRVSPYTPVQSNAALGPAVSPVATARYSPAPPGAPLATSAPPPASSARYSPAPTSTRPPNAGYAPPPTASAPPVLPHQPRTSSPLAHFEISHERSRSHPAHYADSGLAERRSSSSLYDPRLQRVPSLPPTREVDEEDGPFEPPVASPPAPFSPPPASHGSLPYRPMMTPPPSTLNGPASTLSPPKRVTSNYSPVATSRDFAPPPRSQTQSPGALYGNRNAKPMVDPIPRPSSVHDPAPPHRAVHPAAGTPPVATTTAPRPMTTTRPRGFSQNLNLVAPTDGRENDVLQRWRGAPLISWGVGGTIVTMFPKDVPRYGITQTVPQIVRSPGDVKIKNVKDLQPLEERLAKFPGPLRGKSKKKETMAWLSTGIEGLERGLPSQHAFSQAHFSHEDKRAIERVLLWKILRLFIEHDGVLEGHPTVEKAVRDILSSGSEPSGGAPVYLTGASLTGLNETPATAVQSDSVDSSAVEQIRHHLLDGDREKAVWAAVDKRLWGHALLIANASSPDLYKQVAQEFVKKEVNFPGQNNQPLAALYGVLSGNHEESVDELVPVHARAGLQLVAKDAPSGHSKDATEGLDKWRETLGLILGNRSPDDARAINSLGNLLSSYGRAEAAHICFMFARSHTVFGGLDDPNSSFVLVGSDHKRQAEQFAKEIEPLLLSEVYEYGQSLAGGSNVAVGNPHLAAYKLEHALALAEYGFRDKALQYCEALATAITAQTRRSPYHHPLLEAAVEDLAKRLRQAPKEESGSWIPKPSMNKVSDSMWNRFNKFVAGDDHESSGQGSPKEGVESGPFARVAGGTPTVSRSPSTNNLETFGAVPSYGAPINPTTTGSPAVVGPSVPPNNRAASRYAPGAAQPAAPTNAYEPSSAYAPRSSMERTSSELNRGSFEMPRTSSEFNPYSPNRTSSPAQSYTPYQPTGLGLSRESSYMPISQQSDGQPQRQASGYTPLGYQPSAPANGNATGPTAHPAPVNDAHASGEDGPTPLGYQPPSYRFEPPSLTPYEAPKEEKETHSDGVTNGGAYEPPSYQPYGFEPPSYEPSSQPSSNDTGDSDEDSKPKPKKKGIMYDDDDDFPAVPKPAEKSKEEKDRENAEMFRRVAEEEAKRAAGAKQAKKGWGITSWFGGGAKKDAPLESSAPNKPIRAKLGEANSFYYDPEQKRWVNKNASPEDNAAKKSTAPPPRSASGSAMPPRSATSSPAPPMAPAGPPRSSSMAPDAAGRASAPPGGPRSVSSPTPSGPSPASLAPPAFENGPTSAPGGAPSMMRSVSGTSTASAPPSRPTTSLSNSSSIDDLLSAAGPRKAGAKKPRKSARYVDVMTK